MRLSRSFMTQPYRKETEMPKPVVTMIDSDTYLKLHDEWVTIMAESIQHEGGGMTPAQEIRMTLSRLSEALERVQMLAAADDDDGKID